MAGGSKSRGRGTSSIEGGSGRMGGGNMSVASAESTMPLSRGVRGRGGGNYSNTSRRPTIVHTAPQDPAADANRLNAALKATQESHRKQLAQLCLQSWEESGLTVDHGPPPKPATETRAERTVPPSRESLTPQGHIREKATRPTARKLVMGEKPDTEAMAQGAERTTRETLTPPEFNSREDATSLTALKLGREGIRTTTQADANVNPLPDPLPLRVGKGKKTTPSQGYNTSPSGAVTNSYQHSRGIRHQDRDASKETRKESTGILNKQGTTTAVLSLSLALESGHNTPPTPEADGAAFCEEASAGKTTLCETTANTSEAEGSHTQALTPHEDRRDESPKKAQGDNTHPCGPDEVIFGIESATVGLLDFTIRAAPEKISRREQGLFDKYLPYHTKTAHPPPTHQEGNEGTTTTAAQSARKHHPEGSEDIDGKGSTGNETNGLIPSLTKVEAASVEKQRRRKLRATGQSKKGTACFTAKPSS